jgi:hypothetical protein
VVATNQAPARDHGIVALSMDKKEISRYGARAVSQRPVKIDLYRTEIAYFCQFRRYAVKKKERGRYTPSLPKKERISPGVSSRSSTSRGRGWLVGLLLVASCYEGVFALIFRHDKMFPRLGARLYAMISLLTSTEKHARFLRSNSGVSPGGDST